AQKEIPDSMLCIGGGYIGLELGMCYAKLGTKVTVVEATANLLSGVDPDLTKVVARKLQKMGVEVKIGVGVKSQKSVKKGIEVTFADGKSQVFEKVLVT